MRILLLLCAPILLHGALPCDLSGYRAQPGLQARVTGDNLEVAWTGDQAPLRAVFGIENGTPVVRELAVGGKRLAAGLRPEFEVKSGVRRISNQQLSPMKELGIDQDATALEREKWNVFWDAPLQVPGSLRTNPGLPRTAGEVRVAKAKFASKGCVVVTDGARLEISFDGLEMGHLPWTPAVHGLSRVPPAASGGNREDRRAVGGLQVCGRAGRHAYHRCQPRGVA